MIEEYIHSAERYAHRQAVLDAGLEALKLRGQRNALGVIAVLLALLAAIRSIG